MAAIAINPRRNLKRLNGAGIILILTAAKLSNFDNGPNFYIFPFRGRIQERAASRAKSLYEPAEVSWTNFKSEPAISDCHF
jgi:hypothetical protein